MTETPSRQRQLAAFVLLMTFGSGALVGLTLERVVFDDDSVPVAGLAPVPAPGGPNFPARVFGADSPIVQNLELTAEQTARIDSILEEDRAKAGAVLGQMRPRLQARYDSTTAAIAGVLTAEQRTEFERLTVERRARIEQRFGQGRGGGRPGPRRP